MVSRYVRSTTGSDANTGLTWALAKATIAGALSSAVAGDTIWVSQVHAETQASAMSLSAPGTPGNPTKILCGNDAAQPPTSLATTATVTTTGTNAITLDGSAYYYGITFNCSTGSTNANITLCNSNTSVQTFESCNFILLNTAVSSIKIAGGGSCFSSYYNCGFKFSAAGQFISISSGTPNASRSVIKGGSLLSGGTSPTSLIRGTTNSDSAETIIDGFNLSNANVGITLVSNIASLGNVTFRGCVLPTSWSGSVANTTPIPQNGRVWMVDCDSGNTNYRQWLECVYGNIKSQTGIYRNGGVSDGTTNLSLSMTTYTALAYPVTSLRSHEFMIWNDTIGSSKTATIEIVYDNLTTLNNNQVWMELSYMGSSSSPLYTITSTMPNLVTSETALTSSSETWTGAIGMGPNGSAVWNTNKLSITFTPQQKGPIIAVIMVAVTSKTIYVDPMITIT